MKTKGFTLIELLVTMGIIAVLTGMAVFNFNQARVRARDVQRKNDASQLAKALEVYKNDIGGYISSNGTLDTSVFQSTLLGGGYIKTTFNDPRSADWDTYTYLSEDGRTYYIRVRLENKADSTRTTDTAICGLFPNGAGSGLECQCGGSASTGYSGTMYIISNP